MDERPFISVTEAAKMASVTPCTIRRYCQKKFMAVKDGKTWVIQRSSFENWLGGYLGQDVRKEELRARIRDIQRRKGKRW